MASGRSQGLPIFHDDLTFHDRHERSFQDMQRRLDDDFGGGSGFGRRLGRDPWNWEDDLDRLCGDFHQLKPRSGSRVSNLARDDFGSRESLDDNGSNKSLYIEHPQTKSRTFHMSFDVKNYNPGDITVKADGDNLVIMARHEDDVGGHVNVREFSRKIKIPKEVDIDKLTSTLSNDGILTIQAPVPPKYTSVAYVNPVAPVTSNGSASSAPHSVPARAKTNQSEPAPPQRYQYVPPPQTQTAQPPSNQPQLSKTTPAHTQTPSPPPVSYKAPQQVAPPPGPPPLFEQPSFPEMPVDTPMFRNRADGKGREFELALEVPRPFTPEDVVVKLEDKSLKVEATREEKAHGKSSTSSMSRNFDLDEDLDPGSVEAMLRSDGCLLIKGKVKSA